MGTLAVQAGGKGGLRPGDDADWKGRIGMSDEAIGPGARLGESKMVLESVGGEARFGEVEVGVRLGLCSSKALGGREEVEEGCGTRRSKSKGTGEVLGTHVSHTRQAWANSVMRSVGAFCQHAHTPSTGSLQLRR